MKIAINDILIDWVKAIPKNIDGEITKHTVQTGTSPDITTHIRIENRVIPLKCTLVGSDRQYKYDELYELAAAKTIVEIKESTLDFLGFTYSAGEINKDYAITSIKFEDSGDNFIDFSLVLEKMNFANLKTTKTSIEPDKSLKVKASKTKNKKVKASPKRIIAPRPSYP